MSNQTQAPVAPQAPASALEVKSEQPQNVDQLAQKVDAIQREPQTQEQKIEEQKQEARKIKALKLKVYGQEIDEELPFEIDDNPEVVEYLTKQLQMSKAAQRAMQEKGSFEKQVQAFFENLKEILLKY
jgi:hypothetical protein